MSSAHLLPDFYIIGAAKAGTTTLYDVLKQHPAVEMSTVKEPRFFSNDEKYAKGTDWYVETFYQQQRVAAARGEASPQYLYWSRKSAPRFKETYPDGNVKFIAIFREPVQRAYSQYWHAYRAGWDDWTFENAIQHEDERMREYYAERAGGDDIRFAYLHVGLYADQLKPFLERFAREQFLFLLQEDLIRDFAGTTQRMFEFIGIDPSARVDPVVSNPATLPRSLSLLKWLKTPASPRSFKSLIKGLAPESVRMRVKKQIRQANQKQTRYPPMDAALRKELSKRFVDDIAQLQALIGRDLSHWMSK